ncbi:MAG TPA: LytTR family DNA-binding domain-containing protein [Thermoanaerobaculia bacterium]|jgi:two-component system LytT family response regulator|nr:LytTR family DNA-binding domain-containing protein [Thermoanaerobaculia bacterium]
MSLSFRSANVDDEIRERRLAELLAAAATLQRQLGALLGPPSPEPSTVRRLGVRNNGHVLFLAPQEIEWIEAAGNYVRLNAGGESHLLRDTMSGVEGRLPRDGFLRIHRSAIVNLDAVRELEPSPHGDFVVVLKSGKRLPLSRGCRDRLEEALGTA